MWELFGEKGEKKVEYIELIYDLIFVYLLGHSNELLFQVVFPKMMYPGQ